MDIAAAARSVAFRHVKCIQQDSGFCAETFQRVEERLRSYGGLGKGQGLAKTRIDNKNVGQGKENFIAGWQKLCGGTGDPRRKVWTRTKILSPNIRYFVAN